VSSVVKTLGLTPTDVTTFNRLWSEADTNGGYLAAGAAVMFLGTSGLEKPILRSIWSLSDTDTPRGQLDKDEFFLACKLVAMAQAGLPLEGGDWSVSTPLPRLGSCAGVCAGIDDSSGLPHIAKALGLTASDVATFDWLWSEADTNGGYLAAGAAVMFLGTSGLEKPILHSIWSLSDTGTPRGQLDKDEFFLACKLVAMAQAGLPLEGGDRSAHTPLPKLGVSRGQPQPHEPAEEGLPHIASTLGLSASDVVAYEKLWQSADADGGFLSAGAAVKFLGTSGLGKAALREIWEMSDTDVPRGKLDRDEFFVACKLVAMAQAGIQLAGSNRAAPGRLPHFAIK
jgi:hypothetical protein